MTKSLETVYPQSVWDEEHVRDTFRVASPRDQVRNWVASNTAGLEGPRIRSMEIGCFPGGYLGYFGERGFELNGVDLTPRVVPEMKEWLERSGYCIGRIEKGDFFAFEDPQGFDVVLSNGFLEHFEDWESCLHRHLDLVGKGGVLLLVTPNFVGGLQNFLHRKLDRGNYDRHCLSAMNPERWKEIAEGRGFEVKKTEYFADFDFWNGPQPRPMWQKAISRGLRLIVPYLRILLPSHRRWSSPYCGMVARRK